MEPRLAIEIGGTKLQAAVGTDAGEIRKLCRRDVPRGAAAADILALVAEMASELTGGQRPGRVGIGFGGPVDAESGRIVRSFHVAGWDGFELAAWAREHVGGDCRIENDTNCGALAEARVGAGRGAGVVVYTNIGTGIGGGLVVDGQLYSRPIGCMEIGHTKLWDRQGGDYCIVEHLCSGLSIERMARRRAAEGRMARAAELAGGEAGTITARHVGQAAREGDRDALSLVRQAAGDFAVALCNVITLLNPDRVIVGGGVPLMGEVFFSPLRAAVASRIFPPYAGRYEILPAALGEEVVLVGALMI
ncbi:MAG TPA: ROK family protein [Phycisphaerae bacterium]|nr:ROK family protein [Phycisphaerae bacterium]